ncbi:MAG TPA: hypothetical protein VFE62_21140 [Gemmataceae bacterium]|nr:hypothetical protein [Gemmataceae bacterium]
MILRTVRLLTFLCVILAAPGLAWCDALPPPAIQEADSRCESLNAALGRLAREQNVPVRLVYANIGFVEITIPKEHASAADRAGLTALGNDELRFQPPPSSEPPSPARLTAAGVAVSLGVIFAGVFLARKKYLIALTIALTSFVLVTAGALIWVMWERTPVQTISSEEKRVGIVMRSTENGPVRVTVPLSVKPAQVGADIIDNWGRRSWTPPPKQR